MCDTPTSPSSDLDFNLPSYSTAWDLTVAPTRKVKKQYGKTASQKKEASRGARRQLLKRSNSVPVEPVQLDTVLPTSSGSPLLFDSSELSSSSARSSGSKRLTRSRTMDSFSCSSSSSSSTRHGSSNNSFSVPSRKKLGRSHSFTAIPRRSNLLSDFDMENSNPNMAANTTTTTPPPNKMPRVDELEQADSIFKASRPRKIRALSDFGDLQQSFSDLARNADAATGWNDATPTNAAAGEGITFDLDDLLNDNVSERSTRKRTASDNYSPVASSEASSNNGMRKSRARSRIFSDSAAPQQQQRRQRVQSRKQEVGMESDDGGMSTDDDNDMLSLDNDDNADDDLNNKSMDSTDDFMFPIGRVKRPPRNLRRSISANFEMCVFGNNAKSRGAAKVLSNDEIITSMPSVDDLKFLIKSLVKEQKRATKSFGKVTMWTVSLPNKWSSDRRAKVLTWSTKVLGFTMRSGGPSVVFLKLAASQSPQLLAQLESALETSNTIAEAHVVDDDDTAGPPTSIIFHSAPAEPVQSSPPPMDASSFLFSIDDQAEQQQAVDDELLQAVNNLNLSTDKPEQTNERTSLVRLVTLDPHQDVAEKPRHSGEHAVCGQEMASLFHVVSPRRRARNSSFGSRRLSSNRKPLMNLMDDCSAASPFPPGRLSTQSKNCDNVLMETPHMTRRACYETKRSGSDWGISIGCSADTINELTARLQAALGAAGQTTCESSSSLFLENMVEGDEEEDSDEMDEFVPDQSRRSSVGVTYFAGLNLNDMNVDVVDDKIARRRIGSMAKHQRVSLCAGNMIHTRKSLRPSSIFGTAARTSMMGEQLPLTDITRFSFVPGGAVKEAMMEDDDSPSSDGPPVLDSVSLALVFSFLDEKELICNASPVSCFWADIATQAHADLMLVSVGCMDDAPEDDEEVEVVSSISLSMDRPWKHLTNQFPWACFLSEGAFKKVYKVWNNGAQVEEALSVMDVDLIESTGNKSVVGAELAVSAMLSSLVRRNVCPNFVLTRGVFTCAYEPPAPQWGNQENKRPRGGRYSLSQNLGRKAREPAKKFRGNYQYMRMELCSEGDAEEYLKRLPNEIMEPVAAQQLLFQIAFALHAAADRFSLKHYDMKLLNIFLQKPSGIESTQTTMRYGFGSHVFAMNCPTQDALVAKVADYGTAIVDAECNGQPVTIAQFTTIENTPPEFMILGDAAEQGHGHDAFGLGLCFLHLFTGHAPYEEILESVTCPPGLKKKLSKIWEDESEDGYSVIRSVVLADVCFDEDGDVLEGEPDAILYDTLYRYIVLFGIPEKKYKLKKHGKVWKTISSCLASKKSLDSVQFAKDCKKYSLHNGTNKYISRARRTLLKMDGGMDLLLSLVDFDPATRATASDVINSKFMTCLQEVPGTHYPDDAHVMSYMAYAT